jgi:hypothetical protein
MLLQNRIVHLRPSNATGTLHATVPQLESCGNQPEFFRHTLKVFRTALRIKSAPEQQQTFMADVWKLLNRDFRKL